MQLEPVHSMRGNTQHFQIGAIEIRVDDEWRRQLPSGTRRFIELTAMPLPTHYGYPVRT